MTKFAMLFLFSIFFTICNANAAKCYEFTFKGAVKYSQNNNTYFCKDYELNIVLADSFFGRRFSKFYHFSRLGCSGELIQESNIFTLNGTNIVASSENTLGQYSLKRIGEFFFGEDGLIKSIKALYEEGSFQLIPKSEDLFRLHIKRSQQILNSEIEGSVSFIGSRVDSCDNILVKYQDGKSFDL